MAGSVLRPVESTMRTRRLVSVARNVGSARRGFEAILSSSRLMHDDSVGGRALRKLTEISRASKEELIWGNVVARNDGTALGVDDDPISR